jgi:hypothetical protein
MKGWKRRGKVGEVMEGIKDHCIIRRWGEGMKGWRRIRSSIE